MIEGFAGAAGSAAILGRGLLFGLAIAAPVGPIGLLVIRRTLAGRLPAGLATGFGVAAADATYGVAAALAFSAASAALAALGRWPAVAGALFLAWLAWRSWRAEPSEQVASETIRARDVAGYVLSGYALTITNPMTLAVFAGLFLGAGVAGEGAILLVIGVFCGSFLWWLFLTTLVSRLRHGISIKVRRMLERASALLMGGFALFFILRAVLA